MNAAGPQRIDELLAEAGIDPALGAQAVASGRLASVAFDPSLPLLLLRDPGAADGGDVLPGRHARAGARDVLAAPTRSIMSSSSCPGGARTGSATSTTPPCGIGPARPAARPDREPREPARDRRHQRSAACPGRLPLDRRQTHLSLRPYLLEEAYETLDAIEQGAPADLAEELGDLLLQVVLHAQFAAEEGEFDMTDVYRSIARKIVRRHPHVFGGLEVAGVDEVLANWETIKAGERAERGKEACGAFGGVARALPALPASREIQERASSLGWDWDAIEGVWEKVGEELDELRDASSDDERLHEIGDVLFALVNLARWMKVDPEEALRTANHRWVARYRRVEALAAKRGVDLDALSLAEKDLLWDEVKAGERTASRRDRGPRDLPRRSPGPAPERRADRCRVRGRCLQPAPGRRGRGRRGGGHPRRAPPGQPHLRGVRRPRPRIPRIHRGRRVAAGPRASAPSL